MKNYLLAAFLIVTPSAQLFAHSNMTEGLDRKISALHAALKSFQSSMDQRFLNFEQRISNLENPPAASNSAPTANNSSTACTPTTQTEYQWGQQNNQLCTDGVMGKVSYEEKRTATTDCSGNTTYTNWKMVTGQEASDRQSRRTEPSNCLPPLGNPIQHRNGVRVN
ncbi:hypothetical protein [Pseudophaeobacter sp. A-200-2]|uniref:hypothetical protein n=1 Tax=Pseudophaeobacter sp. A-200-2 TaxID=3098145 RepID=UPI0034D72D9B